MFLTRYFSHVGKTEFDDRKWAAEYQPYPDAQQKHQSDWRERRAADQIWHPAHKLHTVTGQTGENEDWVRWSKDTMYVVPYINHVAT